MKRKALSISMALIVFLALSLYAAPVPDISQMEKELQAIRGLSFTRPVEAKIATDEMVHAYVRRQFAKNVNLPAWEAGLRDLGFIPKDFNPEGFFLKMLESQILAYYDPETKNFFYRQNVKIPQPPPNSHFAFDLLGMTWLHELDHALQDQHFDLLRLVRLATKNNNQDFGTAVDSLIEGEATYVMLIPFLMQNHVSPEMFEKLSILMKGFSLYGKGLQKAPPIFTQGMLFPYVAGMRFVLRLQGKMGWEKVNAAYRELPRSTHQILHPEAYLERELPVDFDFPPVAGLKQISTDVVGEMGVSILHQTYFPGELRDFSGWKGDRFFIYQKDKKEIVLWVTRWKDEKSAANFFDADQNILRKRFPRKKLFKGSAEEFIQGNIAVNWIKRNGETVYTLENAPRANLAQWEKRASIIKEKNTN